MNIKQLNEEITKINKKINLSSLIEDDLIPNDLHLALGVTNYYSSEDDTKIDYIIIDIADYTHEYFDGIITMYSDAFDVDINLKDDINSVEQIDDILYGLKELKKYIQYIESKYSEE